MRHLSAYRHGYAGKTAPNRSTESEVITMEPQGRADRLRLHDLYSGEP